MLEAFDFDKERSEGIRRLKCSGGGRVDPLIDAAGCKRRMCPEHV
jgi:hypothetical protein